MDKWEPELKHTFFVASIRNGELETDFSTMTR